LNSQAPGDNTSVLEVTHISSHSIRILAHGKKLFMPYEEFPWFKDQPVRAITHVEEQSEGHFYWPEIDVGLSIESIEHPDRFPLRAKIA